MNAMSSFDRFAELVSDEPLDQYVLSHLPDEIIEEASDGHVGVLYEGLLEEARFLVELLDLAFRNLVEDLVGFA